MWFKKCCVYSEVSRRSRVRLDVDSPFIGIKAICLKSTLLAKNLNLINDFISSVVTSMWKTFRVFVGQARSETFNDSTRGEVLRGDKFKRSPLTRFFLFNEIKKLWIVLFKGDKSSEFLFVGKIYFEKKT